MVTANDRWRGVPRLAVAVLAFGLAGGMLAADAAAQAKKDSDATPQKDAAGGQRAYAAGTKAFEAGNMAETERQLSVALSGGGLPNAQMAKALYMRGTAYRQLGKPAQAISDLTTAVWLKGGLSDAEKKAATAERQLAYREAGLGDTPPPVGAAPLDQGQSATATATAPAAPAPAPGAQVATVGPSGFWNNLSLPSIPNPFASSSEPAATPAASPAPAAADPAAAVVAGFAPQPDGAPAAAAPPQEFATAATAASDAAQPSTAQTSSWDTQTAAAAEAAPAQQVAAGYAPVPEAAGLSPLPGSASDAPQGEATTGSNPLGGAGAGISGFFSNMFGGAGSQPAASDASPVTPGSTAPAADWGSETTLATSQTSSMMQRGPDSPVPAPAAPPVAVPVQDELPWTSAAAEAQPAPVKKVAAAKPAAGRYKLQVAAVRSREEAEQLVQTLRSYQAVQAGIVSPEVDEAVIGNMGTFYRVRLGPYADAGEPGQLCQALKPQGFDCLVVTQ